MSGNGRYVERPDQVKIGVHQYKVEWLSADEWHAIQEDPNNAGVTRSELSVIRIACQTGTAESRYQEVLLHEVTHAVWDATMLTHVDLSSLEDKEEFVIGLQSPTLLGVFKDNPGLVKYLMSDGKAVRS